MTREEVLELAHLRQSIHDHVRIYKNHKILAKEIPEDFVSYGPKRTTLPEMSPPLRDHYKHKLLYPLQEMRDNIASIRRRNKYREEVLPIQRRQSDLIIYRLRDIVKIARPSLSNFRLEIGKSKDAGLFEDTFVLSAGWLNSVWNQTYMQAEANLRIQVERGRANRRGIKQKVWVDIPGLKDRIILSSVRLGNFGGEVHIRRIKYLVFKGGEHTTRETYFACALSVPGIYELGDNLMKIRDKMMEHIQRKLLAELGTGHGD